MDLNKFCIPNSIREKLLNKQKAKYVFIFNLEILKT